MSIALHPEELTVAEQVKFQADNYRLHGILSYPEESPTRGVVVFAGPHPLLGGNMQNNVVRSLAEGLASRGFLTLRFDYRGIGQSEGPPIDVRHHMAEFWKTSHTPDEMDYWQDVHGAIEFAKTISPELPLSVVGYSFGCSLLPFVESQQELESLVLIAPTLAKHDYNSYGSVRSPIMVIASEDDFAIDNQRLDDWFASLTMSREIIRRPCDNHFFRGHEEWLCDTVHQFLQREFQ